MRFDSSEQGPEGERRREPGTITQKSQKSNGTLGDGPFERVRASLPSSRGEAVENERDQQRAQQGRKESEGNAQRAGYRPTSDAQPTEEPATGMAPQQRPVRAGRRSYRCAAPRTDRDTG